jgi:NAD(P)-dependent dehydrogenase (short-subunit alcohol dehydrogenase family)
VLVDHTLETSVGAMNQLAKNLACEWGEDSIRTNSVAPWYTKTSLVETVRVNYFWSSKVLKFANVLPQEVENGLLASGENSFQITFNAEHI